MKHFGKISVILMYVAIFLLPFLCAFTPLIISDVMIICWFIFWGVEGIVMGLLSTNKLSHEKFEVLMEQIKPYLNAENVSKVVEKVSGIEIKPQINTTESVG